MGNKAAKEYREIENPLDLSMPKLHEEFPITPRTSVLAKDIITTPKISIELFPKLQITPKRPIYKTPKKGSPKITEITPKTNKNKKR